MPSEPTESNFKDKVKIVAYPTQEAGGVVLYMPSDDNTALVFRASWHPCRPLTVAERTEYETGGYCHEAVMPVTYRAYANKSNDYLIDRAKQRTVSYSSIQAQAWRSLRAWALSATGVGSISAHWTLPSSEHVAGCFGKSLISRGALSHTHLSTESCTTSGQPHRKRL